MSDRRKAPKCVSVQAELDGEKHAITFAVVPVNAINTPILLGMDFLATKEFIINNKGVKIASKAAQNGNTESRNKTIDEVTNRSELEDSEKWMFGIQVTTDEIQVPARYQERVNELVRNYKPAKIEPSESKALKVKRFPMPKTAKQMQRFYGLASYFRKFIPRYAERARPLSELLKKDATFYSNLEGQRAFADVKMALCEYPVLRVHGRE